jgi:hypothetical protein
MATRMLAEAEEAEAAAARAEKVAARRAALLERVWELVAERVSAVEAEGKAAEVPPAAAAGASGALLQKKNRPTKVREPIRARLPKGRGGVSEPRAAEERRRLAREARRALEQTKAAGEMAENKAERRREAEWAEERADQRTPEELARARRRRTRCTGA